VLAGEIAPLLTNTFVSLIQTCSLNWILSIPARGRETDSSCAGDVARTVGGSVSPSG